MPSSRRDAAFKDVLQIETSHMRAERAAAPLRYASLHKRRRGPRTSAQQPKGLGVLRDWLLIDWSQLGLERALVRFPGEGRAQSDLIRQLGRVEGVCHIIECAHSGDVYALIVYGDHQEARELRAQLREFAGRMIWDTVISETQVPTIRAILGLARRAAVCVDL